jgi:hypothetical protein
LLILHTTARDKKAAGKNKITVSLTFGMEHCLLNLSWKYQFSFINEEPG